MGTQPTVGRHPLGHGPLARPPTAACQPPQKRGAQGAAPQKHLGVSRVAPRGRGRTSGATPPSGTWGVAHHRVGDANHDLSKSISTDGVVVRRERSEAGGRGFESDPCAFSLHAPFAQRPTAGAPHCADGERVGGAMGRSPRQTAAHCEPAHGERPCTAATTPKETPRTATTPKGGSRTATPRIEGGCAVRRDPEARCAVRAAPRRPPAWQSAHCAPAQGRRAHCTPTHGATRALRPCPRSDLRTAPRLTGRPTYCARAQEAPAYCAPTHRSSPRTASLPPCARWDLAQRATAQWDRRGPRSGTSRNGERQGRGSLPTARLSWEL